MNAIRPACLNLLLLLLAVASFSVANGQSNYTTPYNFTTFAGSGVEPSGNLDGIGTAASFSSPNGVVVDASGNAYIADGQNHKIRKVTPAGVVSTLAGFGIPGAVDGTGSAAFFKSPQSVAMDASGNLFVADTGNHTIRKVTSAGVVTTLAGSGVAGSSDGTGVGASFYYPSGLAVDTGGNVFVADSENRKIRKITPAGVVTTFAGSGAYGSANGTGTAATFNNPRGVTLDAGGNLFVADRDNNMIRKITPVGVVSTFAGSVSAGGTDGTGTAARFDSPCGVAVDASGNIFVADNRNHKIRKITSAGVVSTFAGNGSASFVEGIGTAASFNFPQGVAVDASGNVWVGDTGSHKIRKITAAGLVSTVAGPNVAQDGSGSAANFYRPGGVTVDAGGNVFVADSGNHKIRKITPAGVVTTFAGSGSSGSLDGSGTAATFNSPNGLAVDASGNLFVGDVGNRKIRKITPAGVVTTFAGSGSYGSANGTGTAASFSSPQDVALDANGNVYVADSSNNMIRKITSAGVVTTYAGSLTPGSTDGAGMEVSFNYPEGVAVDTLGNVYVADCSNHKIRKITPAGQVSTLAGTGSYGSTDGAGTVAKFHSPEGVAVDASGNVFVADTYSNHMIRKITPAGVVSTIAGSGYGGSADGNGAAACFFGPQSVEVDSYGNVFVADTHNHKIRKGVPGPMPQTITFNPLMPKSSADAPFVVSASATSGLPVGFSIFSGPATLSGNTVTLTGSGTVVVCATQPGSASVEAAPIVYQSFIVAAGTSAQFKGYDFTTMVDPAANPLVALDETGNLFVWSSTSNTIRKITPAGVVSTFADTTGLNFIRGLTVDATGNVYVAAMVRIYKITPAGVVTTLAGSGSQGTANGIGTAASFYDARSVAIDASGNVFVADTYNGNIRKISPSGVVTTFAGSGNLFGATDGIGMAAGFNRPQGVAVDSSGNVFVADTDNHKIRKITPAGVVTTLAGSRTRGSADGTGAAASFYSPQNLAVDSSGNVFVADTGNHKIRKITPWGEVTTVAGSGSQGNADGTGKVVSFNNPAQVAVDASGNLFVADSGNAKVRKGVPMTVTILPQVITFGDIQDKTADDVFVLLSASSTSNLAVTFSIVSGPATVSGNVITLNGPGTVIVRADQAGNDFYTAAPTVEQSFSVSEVSNITPQTYTVSNAAGSGVLPSGNADGSVPTATFNNPSGVAIDASGNLFVADTYNNKIRKISLAGGVTTLAGSGVSGSTDGVGTAASFAYPSGVAVDASGNVFVADTGNHKIRKITAAGVVSTLAGSGNYGSENGTGTAATFGGPKGVAVDASGNVFVADTGNSKIRKITSVGMVSTLAGSGTQGSENNLGENASFYYPEGVAVDASGNVYVADTGNCKIRMIPPSRWVSTFAGSGAYGSANGTGAAASFFFPSGIALDSAGNLIIADTNNGKVRKITSSGVVTTIAGSARGAADGTGTAASFRQPIGVTVDASGNIFVADASNHNIRKISPAGEVTTISGTIMAVDGDGMNARFWNPIGVAVDANGNTFVADSDNHRIRKITPTGMVTTFAGSGRPDSADGLGTAAGFNTPKGVAVDASGTVFVADSGNMKIRKITPAGEVSTLAGSGSYGQMNGPGASASFRGPSGLALDVVGNVFVTEEGAIRKITTAGVVSLFAGSGFSNGYLDGQGQTAGFNNPTGIAVDLGGNVFIADTNNCKIRKITPAGMVSTFAGSGLSGSTDGISTVARFRFPEGLAVDARGNVFVADTLNNEIRMVTRAGVVTTIKAGFNRPKGVALDSSGNLFVADTENNRIRELLVRFTQLITFDALPDRESSDAPFALVVTASSNLPVTLAVISGPALLSGNTVTLADIGTVVIRASQSGNTTYEAAPAVDRSFLVVASDPAVPLSNWTVAASLSGPDAAPTATPFNDGVPNLLKYAFNMNAAGPDVSVLASNGSSGLPQIALDNSGEEPVLQVVFLRRKGSGLVYAPERSTTLTDFQSMPGTQTVTSIDAQWERVSVQETNPPINSTSGFARVRVSFP